jgi:LysM repeat protein
LPIIIIFATLKLIQYMQARILTVLLISIFSHVAIAQDELIIQGVSPALYLSHTVAAKENWSSLGRLYNASPKEVAAYNALSIDKPLNIGQQVKVPLKITNFSQNGNKAADEVLVPVYHVIQDKEWMYRISVNYNKVPIDRLEKWNGITNDEAKAGMMLIIGYLKVKKDQSPLAALANRPAPVAAVKSTPPPPVVKTEEKQPETIAKQEVKPVTPPVKEEQKAVIINKPLPAPPPATTATAGNGTGGYFRNLYEDSGKATNGVAGVFKSTSGWQDTKYYALMDNVSVGTIIKVVNPSTNKTVFAKVLGELPDMKESIGLTVRISDAAATELGVAEGKFSVAVRY